MTDISSDVIHNMTSPSLSLNNRTNATGEQVLTTDNIGDIPKAIADDIVFAIECVAMPIMVVFGVTGSVLSLVVLSHRKLRHSSTNVLLIGLAISDGMFLITTIIRKPTCIISQFDPVVSYKYFTLSFQVMYYTNICFSRVSTLLVAVISVERLISVLVPLKVKLICTRRRMIYVVIFQFIFTFGVLALIPTQYDIIYVNDMPILQLNEFHWSNEQFYNIYNKYVIVILFRWLPKFVVVICNGIIITSLWKRRVLSDNPYDQASMANAIKTQRKVTVMLVTVAVVFVIALLPGDAFLIANQVVDGFKIYGKYNNMFLTFSDVTLTFEILNSSINFIIYMLLNSTFSDIYFVLFCPCLSRSKRLLYGSSERPSASRSTLVTPSSSKIDMDLCEQTSGKYNMSFDIEPDITIT